MTISIYTMSCCADLGICSQVVFREATECSASQVFGIISKYTAEITNVHVPYPPKEVSDGRWSKTDGVWHLTIYGTPFFNGKYQGAASIYVDITF